MRICPRCQRTTKDDHETICTQCGNPTIDKPRSFRKAVVSKAADTEPETEESE